MTYVEVVVPAPTYVDVTALTGAPGPPGPPGPSGFVHPADYGAVGDGTTDDTAAIVAALAAIAAAGGGALLVTARHKVSADLLVPSNTTIQGDGGQSGFYFVDNGLAANRSLFLDGVSNVRISGVRITCNATGRTGVYGLVRVADSSNVRITGNAIDTSPSVAVYTERATNVEIAGNDIVGCFADGIHVARESKRVRVIGNDIQGCRDDGIGVISNKDGGIYGPCEDVVVQGNTISGGITTGAGVSMVGGRGIVIRGNVIRGAPHDGINVVMVDDATYHGGDHADVSGNTIQGCARGIRLVAARQTTVVGNLLTGSAEYGLGLLAASIGCVVVGNRAYANAGNSVYEESGSGPDVFVGNNWQNNGLAALINGGTGSINVGNLV